MYNIKTNFVQFLGFKQAIKVFAKNYKILHFTKNLQARYFDLQIYCS